MNRIALVALVLSLAACAEANPTMHDAGRDAGAGTDSGTPSDSGTPVDSGVPRDAAPPSDAASPVAHVVFTELRESTADYVELYNTGSASVDLAGYRIADETTADGGTGPSLSNVVTIPPGLALASGGYLVVEANQGATTMTGIVTGCLAGAVAQCVQASWGISNTRGDTVYLLPPVGDDAPLLTATIGPMATSATESWGRLPNGTGDFAINAPTPGAVNAAP